MSYISRAIATKQWGKAATLFGVSIVAGALVIYVLSYFFEIGAIEYLLVFLLVTVAGDFVLAWENERAIAAGKVKLHNEIIGGVAVASEEFLEQEGKFHGKIRVGSECWAAVSQSPISTGAQVRVSGRDGLVLHVEKIV